MPFRRWFALLLGSVALACSDSPEAIAPEVESPLERVDRLELRGAGVAKMVEARGETRMAALLDVGGLGEICVPPAAAGVEGRLLSLGMRTEKNAGTELRTTLGESGPVTTYVVGPSWRDVEIPLPETEECLALQLVGKPGTQAAISTPLLLQPGRQRPWVIFYVVDTLRFDFTPFGAARGALPELAPALEALAADGLLYERVFSTSSWTRPTVATLLTGLGPSLHRVYDRQDRLPVAIERLPSWLAARGWLTEALSSNPNVLPLWGFMPGFDRFGDVASDDWAGHRDFQGLTQRVLLRFQQDANRPLFLYVHDNEPHSPYRPPASYREAFGAPEPGHDAEIPRYAEGPERMEETRALYRAAIRSMSDRVAEMVTGLKRLGRYDDSLIVLVGDHGEEFAEHGDVSHGKTLFQEQLHVPLIIKPPAGSVDPGVVSAPVSTESVAATLLHFLGMEDATSQAVARLPMPGEVDSQQGPIFSELNMDGARVASVVMWPWKYVRAKDESEQLYDLESDPREQRDVSSEQPDVMRSLRTALDRRRGAASTGLALTCVAGSKAAVARITLDVGGVVEPAFEANGLDIMDRVRATPGAVEVALQLRPAIVPSSPIARFRASVAARAQPDRDMVRVPEVSAESVAIRTDPQFPPPRIESASGEPLELDTPIPLSSLAVSVAPVLPDAPEEATCVVYYLTLPSEVTPDEAVDPELRERLRALGYLQ